MLSASDIPGVHVVPAAIAIIVDQTPETQRWNEAPPGRQNHAPSFLQATNWALEAVVVSLDAGTPADPTDDAAAGARIGGTTAVDAANSAGVAASVVKTPVEAVVDAPAAKLGVDDVTEEFEPDGAGGKGCPGEAKLKKMRRQKDKERGSSSLPWQKRPFHLL